MSENIIAAAQAKHIIFWDMRKMKQRTEFTDSFNDEVTCLQFDTQNPAAMMACSFDGQINKFDLSLLNEEDALIWAHRIVESPIQLHFISDVALVQTNDHILIKIDSASLS